MRRLFLALLILAGVAQTAAAEEKITDFLSDVTVNADATITVREAISVNAEGNSIRHGIFRDIPTIYTDARGQRYRVKLDVLQVRRDGQDEPYTEETISNGKKIKIGSADVLVDDGIHAYEIIYQANRELGFFPEFDELYWNVTGNGWPFAIGHAGITVRLPAGGEIKQYSLYTGFEGSTGKDWTVLSGTGATFRAETTRELSPGEGFTVAVAWPKGLVAEPSATQRWGWWISDNLGFFGLILTLAAAAAYYVQAWNKVGRDPPKGVIVPLFEPSGGLGAAATRFVWKQGYDDRTFAAALIGLAVKGKVKIGDDDAAFTIRKLDHNGAAADSSEQALYAALSSGTTTLKQTNHVKIQALRTALQKALAGAFEGKAFILNLGYFAKGAAISAVGLIGSALLLPAGDAIPALFMSLFSSVWWIVILGVIWSAFKGLTGGRGFAVKAGSIGKLLFMIPFIGGGVLIPGVIFATTGSPALYFVIAAAVLLGIMNVVFFYLLRAPTIEGRKLLDQIEGFRMYLRTAEEKQLNLLNPPERTPELFERYLPFALALDCENDWNAKFTAVLAAAAAAGAATAPAWYSGNHWNINNLDGFTSSIGSSLASSISSSSTAPGSSSGSSGGGSSGGGGGGGGGGGW